MTSLSKQSIRPPQGFTEEQVQLFVLPNGALNLTAIEDAIRGAFEVDFNKNSLDLTKKYKMALDPNLVLALVEELRGFDNLISKGSP